MDAAPNAGNPTETLEAWDNDLSGADKSWSQTQGGAAGGGKQQPLVA
jgi:hypothetical protein